MHCGRQIEASIEGGIITGRDLPLAIGSLYRADQFEAPARIWDRIQTKFPSFVGG